MDSTSQSDVLGSGAVSVTRAADAAAPLNDDSALMLRYRDGDQRAFELLYTRHKGPLYRYLERLCHHREVANDLFQEAWSKVIANRASYEPRAQFKTYLFHIAHNCAIDHFRRSERRQLFKTDDVSEFEERLPAAEADRPDVRASESELRAAFENAFRKLPPEQRDAFVLHEEGGFTLEEIGKITGVAMETAKSRLRYALSKLRVGLKEYAPQSAAEARS
jgi:RNA polymerase sigma-70 factor (ECF subfamily)